MTPMKGYSFRMVTRSATRAVLISRPVSTFPMEAPVSRMRSGIQTGSMGVLGFALMMRALSLSAVSTLARQQQNMDFPQPGLPHTVMIFDIRFFLLIRLRMSLPVVRPDPRL